MHEMSIAQNIVEIVQQGIPPETRGIISSVKLRVGELSGVVPDSLTFCFGVVSEGTQLHNAKLLIEKVPLVEKCQVCSHEFQTDLIVPQCPACQSGELEIISGRELQVVEFMIDDGEGTS